ncbi:MAG: hypothetical protein PVJ34_20300, partial [Anaerolineae bacterium]
MAPGPCRPYARRWGGFGRAESCQLGPERRIGLASSRSYRHTPVHDPGAHRHRADPAPEAHRYSATYPVVSYG